MSEREREREREKERERERERERMLEGRIWSRSEGRLQRGLKANT